jgi:hypothetical protein
MRYADALQLEVKARGMLPRGGSRRMKGRMAKQSDRLGAKIEKLQWADGAGATFGKEQAVLKDLRGRQGRTRAAQGYLHKRSMRKAFAQGYQ